MWFKLIKGAFDGGNPLYTVEAMRGFVITKKITAEEYEEITGVSY